MRLLKNIFTALIFLLAITFALKNNGNVSLYYYFQIGPVELPLYLLVFMSAFVGMLIGGVDGLVQRTRSNLAIRRLRKELEHKEDELTSLRNLPITEADVSDEEN